MQSSEFNSNLNDRLRNSSGSGARVPILFLNRSNWPDIEATGQLLSELCEDLAVDYDVAVLAGQPNQNPLNVPFCRAGVERRHGVTIVRVRNTRFAKSSLARRASNLLSYLAMAWLRAVRLPRPEIVVVETDPFLLPLLGLWLQYFRGCKLVVYLQDIYPDVAVALGKVRDGRLVRLLRKLLIGIYCRADRVVVPSEDMKQLLVRSGVPEDRIECIPNWADTTRIYPVKHNNAFRLLVAPEARFVIMYSGNIGLSQNLETVLTAAELLRDREDLVFLLVGDGASKQRLELIAAERRLSNVKFLSYQPKEELAESLSAADLHLMPIDARVTQCMMPSKLYGILASGTPVVAIAPPASEMCRIVDAEQVGLTVPADDAAGLARAIRWALANPVELRGMGTRARRLAESIYDRRHATRKFSQLLRQLLVGRETEAAGRSAESKLPAVAIFSVPGEQAACKGIP